MRSVKLLAAAFLAVAGSIVLTDAADAKTKHFKGTRDQVRAACKGDNKDLIEGVDSKGIGFTMCINTQTNVSVVCGDDGKCTSTSRTAVLGIFQGGIGGETPVLVLAKPRLSVQTPEVQEAPPAPAPKLGIFQTQLQ
jgi:hypothetical protein